MVPRDTGNNAYAKFWRDKQRALWYFWKCLLVSGKCFVLRFIILCTLLTSFYLCSTRFGSRHGIKFLRQFFLTSNLGFWIVSEISSSRARFETERFFQMPKQQGRLVDSRGWSYFGPMGTSNAETQEREQRKDHNSWTAHGSERPYCQNKGLQKRRGKPWTGRDTDWLKHSCGMFGCVVIETAVHSLWTWKET